MEDYTNPTVRGGLDEQEESVRIAVRALGDMRNSAGTVVDPTFSFQETLG